MEHSRACLWWVLVLVGVALAACAPPSATLPAVPMPTSADLPPISFPRDLAAHDALTEWWYYTGHLQAADGHRYGFEFTIFQLRRQNSPTGVLAHFAITDVEAGSFSHQARTVAGQPQEGFDFHVQGWSLGNDGSADRIDAAMAPGAGAQPAYALTLRLVDQKPPALHHGGLISYGDAGSSYYYSRTRLAVDGTLIDATGAKVAVSGVAWTDHQWGDFVITGAGGWDWFSAQLDDDSELMLYQLRGSTPAASMVYGSLISPDGTVRELDPASVRTEALGQWTSPHTGATYPSGWTIQLAEPHLLLTLTPQVLDQELFFPGATFAGPSYWEGSVEIMADGTSAHGGSGYVELTGYAPAGP